MKEYIYMPNELFSDLANLKLKSSLHTAFAYSYYYYINYLYRYCKYQGDKKNTQAEIKQFLGYSPIDKKVDYIIKKGGELDKLGYTLTTTDYPVRSYVEENILTFVTIKELKNESSLPTIITERNFKVKYPVKAFYRTEESKNSQELDGTFFDVGNTHRIDFKRFKQIMEGEGMGTTSFYIYSYIRYKNDKFGAYQVSFENLSKELGMSKPTLTKHIKALEEAKLLYVKHRTYVHGKTGKESNNYLAL